LPRPCHDLPRSGKILQDLAKIFNLGCIWIVISNYCWQFAYHHVITQITVSHIFCFIILKIAPPLHPLWPVLGGVLPPQ
jgi:hypothetical protein